MSLRKSAVMPKSLGWLGGDEDLDLKTEVSCVSLGGSHKNLI